VLDGFAAGTLNPFGPSGASGLALYEAAQIRGEVRSAKGTMTSLDLKVSRPLLKLAGGEMALALGAELRRERQDYHQSAALANDEILGETSQGPDADFGRSRRVSAVFGEVEAVDLTAGRRLQLACERRGATGFVIKRRSFGGTGRKEAAGSVAATRWRVASAPSEPPSDEFGLGAPRFAVTLERSRGGRSGAWILEADRAYSWEAVDVAHPLRLVADLGDRELAPAQSPAVRRAA